MNVKKVCLRTCRSRSSLLPFLIYKTFFFHIINMQELKIWFICHEYSQFSKCCIIHNLLWHRGFSHLLQIVFNGKIFRWKKGEKTYLRIKKLLWFYLKNQQKEFLFEIRLYAVNRNRLRMLVCWKWNLWRFPTISWIEWYYIHSNELQYVWMITHNISITKSKLNRIWKMKVFAFGCFE